MKLQLWAPTVYVAPRGPWASEGSFDPHTPVREAEPHCAHPAPLCLRLPKIGGGGPQGQLLLTAPTPQISMNESMQVVSRRVVTVAYGEPVHHVMQFDPADPGYLYLMTSHQVRPAPRPTLRLSPPLRMLVLFPAPPITCCPPPSIAGTLFQGPASVSPASLAPPLAASLSWAPPLPPDDQGEGGRVRGTFYLRGLRGRRGCLLRLVHLGDAVRPGRLRWAASGAVV